MKKLHFYTLIFLLLVFASCEDVIDVELNTENIDLIVVEAQISTADAPFCRLSKAEVVTSTDDFQSISGATIFIENTNDETDFVYLSESTNEQGFYTLPANSNYQAQVNSNYKITIQIDDLTITGVDSLAQVSPIDSIQIFPSLVSTPLFLSVYNYGKESPTPNQFYKWEVVVNDTVINSIGNINYASDELINGNDFVALEVFTDFHDPEIESERILGYMDTVQLRQTSISAFIYDYYTQLSNQNNTGFLFSVPPANIKGNLTSSDGSTIIGYFSAHDVSISNSVIIDDSIEDLILKL